MPQLDPSTFAPQLFWLLVTFTLLYLVMWKVALPRVADLLQERQERIDDDLERAQKLRDDAGAVLAAYEKTIADGRASAQDVLRAAMLRMAEDADAQHAALTGRLASQTAEAEARINEARDRALKDIRAVAAQTAQAAAGRLIGADVADDEAERAVAAALEARG